MDHNVCSPFENRNFSDASDSVETEKECSDCLPDCNGTDYTAIQSEAQLR